MHYGNRLKGAGAATCALALFALVAVIGTANQAWAAVCGGAILNDIQQPAGTSNPGPFLVGSTVTIKATLNNINATSFTVTDFIQKLSCQDTTVFALCTAPDDSVTSYQGNITTNCGVTWNANTSVAGQVTFTPATALTLAAGATCNIAFDVKIEKLSQDTTPDAIQWANDYDGNCPGPVAGGAQGGGVLDVLECSVEVDKQVSCDGGTTWFDVSGVDDTEPPTMTLSDLCIGFNAFDSTPATDIKIRYRAKNTGTVDATCSTGDTRGAGPGTNGLFDTNLVILPAGVSTTVPASQTAFADITTITEACSSDLVANEPDTATLLCQCTVDSTTFLAAASTDSAKFACVTPGLGVSKTCGTADANGDAAVTIGYESSGTAPLSNCKLTDVVFQGECDPVTGLPTTSTVVDTVTTNQSVPDPTSSPTSVDLTASGLNSTSCNGSDCCNQVTVTCDVTGSPGPETISGSATDNCEIQQGDCFTRTPGFWGEHVAAQNLLYSEFGPVFSCGVDLDTSLAKTQGSGTEDICSIGGGKNNPPQTNISNTQRQLERQCAAANMNIAVSDLREVSCEGALPGITSVMDVCCNDPDSVCNAGPTALDTTCIGLLDFFNNFTFGPADATDFGPPGADPTQCQASKKSGFVNARPRP